MLTSFFKNVSLLIALFVSLFSFHTHAAQNLSMLTAEGTEISYTVYPAGNNKGDTLFLWLYSEAGPQDVEATLAVQLAKHGIETWRIDLFEAHFLPVATSSMDRIPATDISELISYAHKQTGKKIIPVTTGRGSLPVLRGVRHWQLNQAGPLNHTIIPGVILMSPKFYVETPEPGIEGKLLPIVSTTNLPLFIIQPAKSPWFWKLDKTVPALEKYGSDVFVQRLANVRDRYYFRPDADTAEKQETLLLPKKLHNAARYLIKLPHKQRRITNTSAEIIAPINVGKKERSLKPYRGNPSPPELSLQDMHGKTVSLSDLKGHVVLVNFWASWCPPCVHEMPSMQQLQNQFRAEGFTILGVNMAEDKQEIHAFLTNKIQVNFPILLDSDGAALKRWNVFAFPTSYVIGKSGKIRYAIFGGIDWNTPAIKKIVRRLTNEDTK